MNNGFQGFEWEESVTTVKKEEKKKQIKLFRMIVMTEDAGYWQWEWTNEEADKQCFITEICRSWWIVAVLGGGSGNN